MTFRDRAPRRSKSLCKKSGAHFAREERLRARLALGLALGLCAGSAARTQPVGPVKAADCGFLESLGLARARTELYEQAQHLPLKGDLTIGTWAAQDIDRDRQLRQWVRARPRCGDARLYSDGSCDIDVRLEPDELARQLAALLEQTASQRDAELTAADILAAARDWPTLWSTGSARPAEKTGRPQPVGWEDVSLEGIQLARQAAVAEAVHALLEQAGRLKVTPARRVHEFLDSDGVVFEAVYKAVGDAATIVAENAPDQVAVADARLSATELICVLTDVHEKHYHGDLFHAPDFREMALTAPPSELRATGLATPPNRYRRREPFELTELDGPSWATTTLSVTGRHVAAEKGALGDDERVEGARSNAMDELAEQVKALVVHDDLAVKQWLERDRELNDDVILFLTRARVVGPPRSEPDGALLVRVELPLERLWKIVRRAEQRVPMNPPENDAATTQPAKGATP
jgi:hypothetical protein